MKYDPTCGTVSAPDAAWRRRCAALPSFPVLPSGACFYGSDQVVATALGQGGVGITHPGKDARLNRSVVIEDVPSECVQHKAVGSHTRIGTPDYAPPEQDEGRRSAATAVSGEAAAQRRAGPSPQMSRSVAAAVMAKPEWKEERQPQQGHAWLALLSLLPTGALARADRSTPGAHPPAPYRPPRRRVARPGVSGDPGLVG